MANSIVYDDADLIEIFRTTKTIAVVGLDADPARPSHGVAKYLKEQGYTIIPVNPNEREVFGLPCYPDLASVPVPVDMVNIFRRAEFIPPIVGAAIAAQAKYVWMQNELLHHEAAAQASAAGLRVVMDTCSHCQHRRLAEEGKLP